MYKRKQFSFQRFKKLKSYFVYNQTLINKIIYNTPLLMVIKDYVVLKKSGKDYVGRCPFCKTLTTNDYHFRVSEKKRVYKCFECGCSGRYATDFIKNYHDIPFDIALKYINHKYHSNKYDMKSYCCEQMRDNIDEDLPF